MDCYPVMQKGWYSWSISVISASGDVTGPDFTMGMHLATHAPCPKWQHVREDSLVQPPAAQQDRIDVVSFDIPQAAIFWTNTVSCLDLHV